MSLESKRDIRFDWMRGTGILLMLLGHAILEGKVYNFIYSFHMPLFFILSGYFAKPITFDMYGMRQIALMTKRMLMPLIIIVGSIILFQYFTMGKVTRVIGPLWFLLALYWARIITGGLFQWESLYGPISMAIGIAALCVSKYWIDTHCFLIQGMIAVPFVATGYYAKHHTIPMWIKWCAVVCWVLALYYGGIDMRDCRFECYPLDLVGAFGACYLLYRILGVALRKNLVMKVLHPLDWCGRNSMSILCAHAFEWKALNLIAPTWMNQEWLSGPWWLVIGLRFIITMLLASILVYTPRINKIFK